jgi:hypothetical protein
LLELEPHIKLDAALQHSLMVAETMESGKNPQTFFNRGLKDQTTYILENTDDKLRTASTCDSMGSLAAPFLNI